MICAAGASSWRTPAKLSKVARHLALLSFVLVLAACPTKGTDHPPKGGRAAASEPGEPELEHPIADGAPRGRTGPELPTGAACEVDADCGKGQVCEGVGCGVEEGRCAPNERVCTRDLARYCGCDGETFTASGTCPGARYAHRGACGSNLEDGEPCTDGRQCRSGACVGEGLEGCGPGSLGVCGHPECTADVVSYCSCNNAEFRTSSTCPNRQFAYRGPCEG